MSRFGKTYFQDRATKLTFKSSSDMSTSSDSYSSCLDRSTNNSSSSNNSSIVSSRVDSSSNNSSTSTSPRLNKKHLKDASADIGLFVPRDSIDVLNELKPGLVFITRPNLDGKINAYVEVDGTTYMGIGKSEPIARQAAAENALKDLFVDTIISSMTNDDNDDILCNTPEWKLLGSFAMFKLIEEWLLYYASQTVCKDNITTTHESPLKNEENKNPQSIATSTPKIKDEAKQKLCKPVATDKNVLPQNTNAVVLLNSLLGTNLEFQDLKVNSNVPPFTFSLIVDGVEYVGEPASSKKTAKQNTARKVLIRKYGYEFTK